MGTLPPPSLTDPDVQISRIRLFTTAPAFNHRAVPGFVLARSAIRCRFVDRFVGFRVPSPVSGQRFSTHDASLPSVGSR